MRVRAAEPRDAQRIAAIYRPYVERTAISFELDAPDADEIARRMGALAGWPFLVAVNATGEDAVCGYAYAGPHRARAAYETSVDVTVYVDEAIQRAGAGGALYGALLPLVASRGAHRAYAGITLPNGASVALHERFGFRHVGTFNEVGRKFGRFHDVGWWERPL